MSDKETTCDGPYCTGRANTACMDCPLCNDLERDWEDAWSKMDYNYDFSGRALEREEKSHPQALSEPQP